MAIDEQGDRCEACGKIAFARYLRQMLFVCRDCLEKTDLTRVQPPPERVRIRDKLKEAGDA